jgi:clathrin adaptor complex small subunit
MDNELVTLEIIHRYVEVLDRYFGNVRLRGASLLFFYSDRFYRFASWICMFLVC